MKTSNDAKAQLITTFSSNKFITLILQYVNDFGLFDFSFPTPPNANLFDYSKLNII